MSDGRPRPRGPAAQELEHAAAFRSEVRRFLARTEAATHEAGLTVQRYDLVLAITAAGGELTINELCRHLGMRQTAVTELVKRAEEAGLVVRSGSRIDRRVVLVTVTTDAKRRLARTLEAMRADRVGLAETFELLKAALEPLASQEIHPGLDPVPHQGFPPSARTE